MTKKTRSVQPVVRALDNQALAAIRGGASIDGGVTADHDGEGTSARQASRVHSPITLPVG